MNEQDLLELKEKINTSKSDLNRLEGRREHLLQQLKNDHKVGGIAEAKEHLKGLKKNIKNLEEKIEKNIKNLQEEYDL